MFDLKQMIFGQVEKPVVEIHGLRELKEYLNKKITRWNGMTVAGFSIKGEIVYIRTKVEGKFDLKFYGYTDDVASNVQHGFYDGSGVKDARSRR